MKVQLKKYFGIIIISFLVVVAIYNTVYFEKLNAKKGIEGLKVFNPKYIAESFWNIKRDEVPESAIDLRAFDSQMQENPEKFIRQHGKAIDITLTFCFLVKGVAKQRESESGEIPFGIM